MHDDPQRVELLLVEDSPGDVGLTREALEECGLPARLSVARDGEEALAFLRRQGLHAEAPRPHLVLLDLNLPTLDGLGVLADIKRDDDLKRIPVIVLTSSCDEQDVRASYDLHANGYIVKPVGLDRFLTVVRSLQSFWFSTVTLPPGD
jgi:CheY-like chemotaxis protein